MMATDTAREPERWPAPQLDWTRTFTVWDEERERDALFVMLDSGEPVMTWCSLASLAGLIEAELDERATDAARALVGVAYHGDMPIRCVRSELVAPFLSELEADSERSERG